MPPSGHGHAACAVPPSVYSGPLLGHRYSRPVVGASGGGVGADNELSIELAAVRVRVRAEGCEQSRNQQRMKQFARKPATVMIGSKEKLRHGSVFRKRKQLPKQ